MSHDWNTRFLQRLQWNHAHFNLEPENNMKMTKSLEKYVRFFIPVIDQHDSFQFDRLQSKQVVYHTAMDLYHCYTCAIF